VLQVARGLSALARPVALAAAIAALPHASALAASAPAALPAATRAAAVAPSASSSGAPSTNARWAAAESLANAAVLRLEGSRPVDSLALADAYLARGNAHQKYAGYADGSALADGMRALGIRERRGAPPPAMAEAELLVGRVLQGSNHLDSALVHLRRAVDLRAASLAPDDTLIAEAWDQLALAQRDRRDFHAAIDTWDQAIVVRARRDGEDSPAVALMRAQTGACWMELGDRARAREVLEGSLATFARIGQPDHPSRWVPLNILGDLEMREGNLARDVDMLQEALRIVRLVYGEDSRQALTLRWNLANALLSLGDFPGARETCEALEPQMVAQYGPTHSRTLNTMEALAAASAREGRLTEALAAFAHAESLMTSSAGPGRSLVSQNQKEQAQILTRLGRPQEALAMCERARRSALAAQPLSSMDLAETYFQAVLASAALGDTARLAAERRGLDTLQARYGQQPGYFPSTLPMFASYADSRLGRIETAWREALEGEHLAHQNNRLNAGRLSDRRALQYSRRTLSELELLLDQARGDTARTAPAWDCLVREHGLIGTELAQRAVPAGLEADTAVTGAHARWRAALGALARLMVRSWTPDSAGRSALTRARADADEAERMYASILALRGASAPAAEAGLADVCARLGGNQALVSFVTVHAGRDTARITAFVARGGQSHVRAVELGRAAAIADAAQAWRAALAIPPPETRAAADRAEQTCRQLGMRVRDLVWKPIAGAMGGTAEMFVVADGALADLPWAALPADGGRYWVEMGPLVHPLESEPSLMEPPAAATSGRLLAVGNPDFDRARAPATSGAPVVAALVRAAPDPCSTSGPLELAPLPGSGIEADSVSGAWRRASAGPVTTLRSGAAGESDFRREAPGCVVIHVATHGIMTGDRCARELAGTRGMGGIEAVPAAAKSDARVVPGGASARAVPAGDDSPWLSRRVWLAFAGANHAADNPTSDDDGFLTAEEVSTLELRGTDWVVLSACRSGAGDAWTTEGRLGMRRAFELAGARSVIASGWALGDRTTVEWMTSLYGARVDGARTAAAAVQRASRAVLTARRASHRSTHPFYWAAFTSSGH
jgi:CHAT domain-containing protein/tetratricopeptide (TPR) repeat protein